jgi:hypothetical protein
MGHRLMRVAALAAVATLFSSGPAWAYLDPGTGSMLLQLLLGGIAGAMVMGKLYWHRFRGFLASRFSGARSDGREAKQASMSARPDTPDG